MQMAFLYLQISPPTQLLNLLYISQKPGTYSKIVRPLIGLIFFYIELKASNGKINKALDILQAQLLEVSSSQAPFKNAKELYAAIDSIWEENTPWTTYHVKYAGELPDDPPLWMTEVYEFCVRDTLNVLTEQLKTEAFSGQFNYTPYQEWNTRNERIYSNLLSGDWAWDIADEISADPELLKRTNGAMLVPIVLGSDKTTVSVGTGHQEYHPAYISPGNLTNVARRAHGNSVLPFMFFAIPRTNQNDRKSQVFHTFCRRLYHHSLFTALKVLRPYMTTPILLKCPAGHYRQVIFQLGPYIGDYPEQTYLSCIVQGWCPKCMARPEDLDAVDSNGNRAISRTREYRQAFVTGDRRKVWRDFGQRTDVAPFTDQFPCADIHVLLTPDLLHQIIKGSFKDHIVTWICNYILEAYGKNSLLILKDIDRRISAVPAFPGIRRFPDGRDFAQWTGDDSKALMKVYIATVAGYIPREMVKALSSFLNLCYLVRKNEIDTNDLDQFYQHLQDFHKYRTAFITHGTRETISLPCQHALVHYKESIRQFGSPNGLCSSITESKHIKAVKEPWRRSNRYNALHQMLTTILRLDKMDALRRKFVQQGMLIGTTTSFTADLLDEPDLEDLEDSYPNFVEPERETEYDVGPCDDRGGGISVQLARSAARRYPQTLELLAQHINQPEFPRVLRQFLYDQLNPHSNIFGESLDVEQCPTFNEKITVFHSAVLTCYAPSDECGKNGMYRERIRSTPHWHGRHPHRDTVFVQVDGSLPGILGLAVARILLFFSFTLNNKSYSCALVNWYLRTDDEPDEDTGMWVVEQEVQRDGRPTLAVIHLESIAHSAHLLPRFGMDALPEKFHHLQSLDAFESYYINKFANHQMFSFLSSN
ncbi:hypothetical protein E1B28_002146 [Marasmius oreades]|uniref:Uncharacterized protein n=1 Tax=Marasmius oreades TaxID=181124 RepID=A0A9P7RN42_9AGAR|nr:uncharacterized protein E1B28_002146 [Marasmius oreades]KAG7086185.1 hypothetical protein E1B28_002146 [Marasmius oreades]